MIVCPFIKIIKLLLIFNMNIKLLIYLYQFKNLIKTLKKIKISTNLKIFLQLCSLGVQLSHLKL